MDDAYDHNYDDKTADNIPKQKFNSITIYLCTQHHYVINAEKCDQADNYILLIRVQRLCVRCAIQCFLSIVYNVPNRIL